MLSSITKRLFSLNARLAVTISLAISQLAVYGLFLFFQHWRTVIGDRGISTANPFLFQDCLLILLLAAMFYGFAIKSRWATIIPMKALAIIWITLNFLLFLVWPITSSDIFSYVYQGRVMSVHQANPYLSSYNNFPEDRLFQTISNKWSGRTTPYNPLFSALSAIITAIAQDNLVLAVGLFKLLMLGANLFCGWLIYKLTKDRTAFFLYAFNPLILFEFCVNAHNDVLVISSILLGAMLWTSKKTNSAWLVWLAGGLIKATAWIWLPLAFIFDLSKTPGSKPRLLRAFSLASISVLGYLAAYRLFFTDFHSWLSSLSSFFDVVGSYSVGVLAFYGLLIPMTNNPMAYAVIIGKLSFVLIYVLILLLIAKRYLHGFKSLWPYVAIAYSAFFFFFFSWFMPWYLTIAIPFLTLAWHFSKHQAYSYLLFFFTFYGIIYYIALR